MDSAEDIPFYDWSIKHSIPSVFLVDHHCNLSEMDLLGTWMWIRSHG
uniref:Uncharacterized protein n=1 Tax=Arundo donax TaxID=35708 RepID=A0A0A9D209_ARUDO